MGYLYTEEACSPVEIRYTKEKISPRFSAPHNEETIFDMLEKIQGGVLDPAVFPTIRVVKFGGELWSLDNRRLWLFQKAGVESIMVKHMPMDKSKAFKKFLSKTPLAHVQMMAAKQFVPQVDYAWEGLLDMFVRVKKWLRADDLKSEEDEDGATTEWEEEEDDGEEGESPRQSSGDEAAGEGAVVVSREEGEQEEGVREEAEHRAAGAALQSAYDEDDNNQYPVLWKGREYEDDDSEQEIRPVYK